MAGLFDIHCHILPGLDDGAKSRKMMEQMLEAAYESGTRRIIATSHYNPKIFPYTSSIYKDRLVLAQNTAKSIAPDFKIYSGNEIFYTSASIEALQSQEALTLANSNYVLVEFAPGQDHREISKAVDNLGRAGFWPIIAHIERYEAVASSPEYVRGLIDRGAYIQVNASHLLGSMGRRTKHYIHRLIQKDAVHFVASDGHDIRRRPMILDRCARYISKKYGVDAGKRLMMDYPNKIIAKEKI